MEYSRAGVYILFTSISYESYKYHCSLISNWLSLRFNLNRTNVILVMTIASIMNKIQKITEITVLLNNDTGRVDEAQQLRW